MKNKIISIVITLILFLTVFSSFVFAAPILTSSISATPATVNVGDTITVIMTVSNTGNETADKVQASSLTLGGSGTASLSTSPPNSYKPDIAAGGSETFTWTYTAGSAGTVNFTGNASGGAGQNILTSNTATSNDVTIQAGTTPGADCTDSFSVNCDSYENIDFDYISCISDSNNKYQSHTNPSHGSVSVISNRMIRYTPVSGYSGSDSFTFTAGGKTVQVNVTVTCNSPPIPDCTYNVGYNCSTGEIIDMNGSVYDYVNVNRAAKICYPTANYKGSIFLVNPNPGTAVFEGQGNQIDYSLTNCSGLCGQTDTFTFLADKGGAGGDIPNPITIKVNLTIICPPTPVRPVADDDSESVCRNSCVNVSVLDGDTYTLPVTLVVDSGPTSPATATVSGNKINFCANNAEIGNYTFTYHIVQGNETSNTATVTVEVVDCSTTLFANDDSAEACTETCTTINVLKNDVNYGTSPTINIVNGPPSAGGIAKVVGTGVSSTIEYCASEKPGVYSFTYTITNGQETSNEATVIVTVKDCTKTTEKKPLPSSILYPGIDIVQLTVPSSGTNVIFGGKVVSPLEVAPGTQSLLVQVKNKGFLTQIDAGVRLEGLPQGVSFVIEPSTQKIKGHNIGTYSMTLTVPPTTPAGTYPIKAVSYSRRGTTDRVDLNLIVD